MYGPFPSNPLTICSHDFRYNAKVHRHIPKLVALLSGLQDKNIAPLKVIIIHTIPQVEERGDWSPEWIAWDDFVAEGREYQLGLAYSGEIEWNRGSFDAPLWILFSSGTTGRPKYVPGIFLQFFNFSLMRKSRPIVHRAGGMLLQAKKEFAICGNLQPEDVFFYYTTTSVFIAC